MKRTLLILAIFVALTSTAILAQNRVTIDATAAVLPPGPVQAKSGSNRSPTGDIIAVNSQYITRNGKPWLPVMGEFHFSRYPQAEWEEEILKMKAAGVDIISTYVIWIHHEQTEGVFDWSGQRNLRLFAQLCAKHGMYLYPRIGPWAHAETRNGGLPDWVLKNSPTRQNDPVYLREVNAFYRQIGDQLSDLLWKDGGPVIGIQIENEYRDTGPGKGDEHIRTLKQMAIAAGLDVPLYTVTGWDGASVPLDAVLPVFGGYPDAPWDSSPKALPPNEVYAFRFRNRVAGNMGAIGGSGQNAASVYHGTPFLTAEVGAGIQDTYYRRPIVNADDIAAVIPVMLGSGVNLLGYYMFHGGRNPEGGDITLQESQRTGYATDVPVESYDFQAPLGEFGQERESLRRLKLVHYFLHDFGDRLAPMAVYPPSVTPSGPADTVIPRVSARVTGQTGFIFFNNYVRDLQMPARPGFQIDLKLPAGSMHIPAKPIALPSGAYGIWPVNLPVGLGTLRYATAQLFKQVVTPQQTYLFLFAIPGIQPELVLDRAAEPVTVSAGVTCQQTPLGLRLRAPEDHQSQIQLAGNFTLVIFPEHEAESIWRTDDPAILLRTNAMVFADGGTWTLQADGDPNFTFGIFGAHGRPASDGTALSSTVDTPLFANYRAEVPAIHPQLQLVKIRSAHTRGPWQMAPKLSWRPTAIPYAPEDTDFRAAALWRVTLPPLPASPTVADIFLQVRYQGDVGRFTAAGHLLDDSFWNGQPWTVGLKELGPTPRAFNIEILPLPAAYPMYLQSAPRLHFRDGMAVSLDSVRLIPRYQLTLHAPIGP